VHAALVRAAERELLLQFGAIRGLRALALFLEACEDVEPFAMAVVFAGAELVGRLRFSVCSFVLTRM